MDGPDFLVMGSGEGSGGNGRPTSVASFFFLCTQAGTVRCSVYLAVCTYYADGVNSAGIPGSAD